MTIGIRSSVAACVLTLLLLAAVAGRAGAGVAPTFAPAGSPRASVLPGSLRAFAPAGSPRASGLPRSPRSFAPAGSPGWLRAFVLPGSPDSLADLERHESSVGVVYPTDFYCLIGSGEIAGHDDPAIDAYAVAHGIALLPRFTCQDRATVHRILTDRATRARVLAGLVSLAASPAYGGLCLDLENDIAVDRNALDSFVAALADRLHELGKTLTVVVVGVTHEDARRSTGFYDDRRLGELADEVFVLGWGVHWAHSAPGPIAPLPWVRQVAAYIASLPNASHFVLGVPMYGLDWSSTLAAPRRAIARETIAWQYTGVLARALLVGATPVRDPASGEMTFTYVRAGVLHTVWYLDAHAVLARLAVARSDGLLAGLWRLGSEDQTMWSSARALED